MYPQPRLLLALTVRCRGLRRRYTPNGRRLPQNRTAHCDL